MRRRQRGLGNPWARYTHPSIGGGAPFKSSTQSGRTAEPICWTRHSSRSASYFAIFYAASLQNLKLVTVILGSQSLFPHSIWTICIHLSLFCSEIFQLFTFILGGQFLLPQRANNGKSEFTQLQNWMTQRDFGARYILSGLLASL